MEILKDFSTTVKVFAKKSFNKKRDLECKEGKVNLEILKDSGTTVKKNCAYDQNQQNSGS